MRGRYSGPLPLPDPVLRQRLVVQLYPDARPPSVRVHDDGDFLRVEYASHRPFAHIAHGLGAGAMTHFGDARKLEWLYAKNDGAHAEFALKE